MAASDGHRLMWNVVRGVIVAVFGDDALKIVASVVVGFLVLGFVESTAAINAVMHAPWGGWWLAGTIGGVQSKRATTSGSVVVDALAAPITSPLPVNSGFVTDVQRYQLITAAGATPQVAIVMTALSMAEDGSGNPSIVSPPNKGLAAGTVDIGILQVNSAHIGQCGIQSKEWLFDPLNNARAAMCILGPGLNYCAWSTYEASCGPGHTGAYRAFMAGASLIAQGAQWQH